VTLRSSKYPPGQLDDQSATLSVTICRNRINTLASELRCRFFSSAMPPQRYFKVF